MVKIGVGLNITLILRLVITQKSMREDALKNLQEALETGFSDFDDIEENEDFDDIRETSEFKELIAKYKDK
jgi:predicted RNase H-like HicB family nuclease